MLFAGPFTILHPNTTAAGDPVALATDGAGGNELKISFGSTAQKMEVFLDGSKVISANSTAIPLGEWTHIAVTRSGGAVTFYYNGAADGSGSNSSTLGFSSCPLYIGVDADSGCTGGIDDYFDGRVDDYRVYNYALPQAEIQSLCDLGGCPG